MIKAIIFDLGSVCFNIDWIKVNEEMDKKYDINILIKSSPESAKLIKLHQECEIGKKDPIEFFRELDKNRHNLNEIVEFYKKMYMRYKKHNKKVYDLIKELKKNFQVICLSDTNRIHLEAHREQGTVKDFDRVFTSFQIGMMKTNPESFKKVLREIGVKPEEAVFIDDTEKNVEVAKSLGIKGILFTDYDSLVNQLKDIQVL